MGVKGLTVSDKYSWTQIAKGNWNDFEFLGVLSHRSFELKDQKQLIIKRSFILTIIFYCKISSNVYKSTKKTKQNTETWNIKYKFLFARKNYQNCLFRDSTNVQIIYMKKVCNLS